MSITAPNNSMQKTVKTDLDTVKADRDWISQNKNTASKEDIASHAATAEKDWEKFTGDTAGLQQSGNVDDRKAASSAYADAGEAFNGTQSDYKEVLGGREAGDLASGDASAVGTQQSLASMIDQGNAMVLHAQQQLNEVGVSEVYQNATAQGISGGPIAGGTASPDAVSATSAGIFQANEKALNPNGQYNGQKIPASNIDVSQ